MGRGEVMGLEKKGRERRSRNTQARSNGIMENLSQQYCNQTQSLEHEPWCHFWL